MLVTGQTPVALRQDCSGAFAEDAPEAASVPYEPRADASTSIIQYVDPADHSAKLLDQGGLFDFGNQVVRIKEVRAAAGAGNITVVVGDRGTATYDVPIGSPASDHIIFDRPVTILSSQVLKITSVGAGWVDVYAVKGDWS